MLLNQVNATRQRLLIKSKVEEDLNVDLTVECAYCIEEEANAHFKKKNFRAGEVHQVR